MLTKRRQRVGGKWVVGSGRESFAFVFYNLWQSLIFMFIAQIFALLHTRCTFKHRLSAYLTDSWQI